MTECTRNLDIEIPAGEVEREFTRIAQGFQKRARIPGFRPGKAPLSLVRQHFSSKIREEMLDTLVPAHLRAAFERESLEPVSTPTLENLDYQPGSAIKFKASFEVMPEIPLGDYRAIRVEKPKVEVTDADVERALEALRERHSRREPSDATEAADGLIAVVEARVLEADGSQGEPDTLPIEVGAEETLPEFSAALRGMKPGEERELEVSYPADYPSANYAGKTRRYHLLLKSIEKKIVPAPDDDFAREATGAESLAALRERMAGAMRAEREHEARHQMEEQVVDELLRQSPFPVPDSLVDKQVEAKVERSLRSLAERGVDPRRMRLDWAKLRATHEAAARREVQAALILDKIAEREHIEAPAEAVEAEVQRAATELQQPVEALRARLAGNGVLQRIETRLRQERVMAMLVGTEGAAGAPEGAATR